MYRFVKSEMKNCWRDFFKPLSNRILRYIVDVIFFKKKPYWLLSFIAYSWFNLLAFSGVFQMPIDPELHKI